MGDPMGKDALDLKEQAARIARLHAEIAQTRLDTEKIRRKTLNPLYLVVALAASAWFAVLIVWLLQPPHHELWRIRLTD
jgi:hypothetical protein